VPGSAWKLTAIAWPAEGTLFCWSPQSSLDVTCSHDMAYALHGTVRGISRWGYHPGQLRPTMRSESLATTWPSRLAEEHFTLAVT